MATEYVRLEVRDHIATVTIDRPPVNAMNQQVYRETAETFRSFEGNGDIRVAILTSASERAFLAGADLREQSSATPLERSLDAGRAPRECFWAIYDSEVPVVAAVNGAALGAGLAVVACCDLIVAAENATFGLPEIDVGLLGGGSQLARLVGAYRMRQAFYTGERISASEMYRLGAVAKVVPLASLAEEARSFAAQIARKSPIAIRMAKQVLNRIEFMGLKEAYRLEQDYTVRLRDLEDSKEAASAFLERREPKFKLR